MRHKRLHPMTNVEQTLRQHFRYNCLFSRKGKHQIPPLATASGGSLPKRLFVCEEANDKHFQIQKRNQGSSFEINLIHA